MTEQAAEVSLVYPSWVHERLTPKLEAPTVRDPGEVELWFHPHPHQRINGQQWIVGSEMYQALRDGDFLERSLSYGDLKWYEANPDRIPAKFHGERIYGWASVVQTADGKLAVPYLVCDVDRPWVDWNFFDRGEYVSGPAGLRAAA